VLWTHWISLAVNIVTSLSIPYLHTKNLIFALIYSVNISYRNLCTFSDTYIFWQVRGYIQKFPNWLPGARTANGTSRCSCIAILWVSLVSLPPCPFELLHNECLLLLFISLSTQSGNFWIHTHIRLVCVCERRTICAHRGSGYKALRVLKLDTRWKCVVIFTLRSLYPKGMSYRHTFDARLVGL
jgi:hypothetical protein